MSKCFYFFCTNNNKEPDDKLKFDWDEEVQEMLLGSIYWLIWITQLPGGILSQKFGSKIIYGTNTLASSILCFLIPTAAYVDYRVVLGIRIIQGACLVIYLN